MPTNNYNQNGWIPLGTDFPVEQINPMLTFYAATIRKDAKDFRRTVIKWKMH
jgi:predicted amidohydrolase YtcJ